MGFFYMKELGRTYQIIQNLSLDVVLGATAMAYLFSRLCEVILPNAIYLILGICVWLIYTFDHLLDAKRIERIAKTRRHRFHQIYFDRLMIVWWIVFSIGLLFAIFLIPKETWQWGAFVVLFSVLHLLLVYFLSSNKSKLVLKELGVSWTYSAGIVVGPFSLSQSIGWPQVLCFGLLLLVTSFNLIMYSYFDYAKDVKNKVSSIAINYGVVLTRKIQYGLFTLITLMSFWGLFMIEVSNFAYYLTVSFLFGIGLFYLLMLVLIDHKSNTDTYRKVGDIVFLLPFLLLLV